jgi:hypothetical protein
MIADKLVSAFLAVVILFVVAFFPFRVILRRSSLKQKR